MDYSVGGYWDCYLVTVILVVWFVYLKIIGGGIGGIGGIGVGIGVIGGGI